MQQLQSAVAQLKTDSKSCDRNSEGCTRLSRLTPALQTRRVPESTRAHLFHTARDLAPPSPQLSGPLGSGCIWNQFQYSSPLGSSQSSSGPAGGASDGYGLGAWDEELWARTANVRLRRPGHSESSFRTDQSVCLMMLRHRYR